MDLKNYDKFQEKILTLHKEGMLEFLFRKHTISLEGEDFQDILIKEFSMEEINLYFNFFLMTLYAIAKKEEDSLIIKKLTDTSQMKKVKNVDSKVFEKSLSYIKENFLTKNLQEEYLYRTKTLNFFYNNLDYEFSYKVLNKSEKYKVALVHLELFSNIDEEKDFVFELNKNSVNSLISKLTKIKKELENE